ncbi:hypothetical protein [Arthrobacter sp. ISL-30]|uniref:hypothetical protein n=1 Tax=Arthrobacter sp. ISL-30 TaxID=2819109 RepID=UPI001BE8E94F|nr:hypothetical protein [Arthrobacter sp. ISL-30]MBT2513176.1 hypothetical protein [Arthrobacter sp. ISL-30]
MNENKSIQCGQGFQRTDAEDLVRVASSLLVPSETAGFGRGNSAEALFRRRGWTAGSQSEAQKQ